MAVPDGLAPEQAIDALDAALDMLVTSVEGDVLPRAGDERLIAVMTRFERFRNALAVVDHEIVHACEATELPHRLQLRTTARLLSEVVRIDEIEARRRVRSAEALRPGSSMSGEQLPAQRPVLAAAVAAGEVTAEQSDRVVRCLKDLAALPWSTTAQVDEAEQLLTDSARRFAPQDFRQIVTRVADSVNPDGVLADDRIAEGCRGISIWQGRDGRYHIKGQMTPVLAHRMRAVLDPLTAPQHGPDGDDLRRPDQRLHDAVDDVFERILRSAGLSDAGGVPATLIVTIDHQSLLDATGYGRLADGHPVAVETLLQAAAEAEIIPAVLASSGKVLALGRTRRIADRHQTAALIARDGGCSFPSCDRPPAWCERHHVRSWLEGGATDVDNLTLVCSYHHHHFERQGWECRMIDGVPNWIPPRWVDHDQKPMINFRIRQRIEAPPLPPPAPSGSHTDDEQNHEPGTDDRSVPDALAVPAPAGEPARSGPGGWRPSRQRSPDLVPG